MGRSTERHLSISFVIAALLAASFGLVERERASGWT
jgi:hypothetical protein